STHLAQRDARGQGAQPPRPIHDQRSGQELRQGGPHRWREATGRARAPATPRGPGTTGEAEAAGSPLLSGCFAPSGETPEDAKRVGDPSAFAVGSAESVAFDLV